MNVEEYLDTLNAPPDLEEEIVDCLLILEPEYGFCTFPVDSHDRRNEGLSLAEQDRGRQKKIRFQMYVPEQRLAALLAPLRAEFSGLGIRDWCCRRSRTG